MGPWYAVCAHVWVLAVGVERQSLSWENHKYPQICFHTFAKANCVQGNYESTVWPQAAIPCRVSNIGTGCFSDRWTLLQTLGLAREGMARYLQPLRAKAVDKGGS